MQIIDALNEGKIYYQFILIMQKYLYNAKKNNENIEIKREDKTALQTGGVSQKPSKTVQLRSLANLLYFTVAEAGKTTSPPDRYPP